MIKHFSIKQGSILTSLLLFSFILLTSCVQGSFKGLYSYYDRSIKEKPEIFINTKNLDTINGKFSKLENYVFIINGNDLKKCLKENDKSFIYIWGAKCSSKICYPLELIDNHCKKNNVSLFIVAEYYDSENMSYDYELDKNILAIDTKHYNTNLTSKYLNLFLKDIDNNLNYDNIPERYLYFEKDKYIKSYESIYDYNDEK
ncbi:MULTISPECIES: hypothetical protein [Flavobacterium]|uniref:Lipoprotein n=1 Tax=Flavobacterium haoranii TaxID=683124 RepID=A0A1M6H3G5_9FLAO|nr:hypothetical protein [Flavobacterium haoranii]SHJ16777.1 hypothetical protein SAMN05444337_1420 [Flavobacterium haoranii]